MFRTPQACLEAGGDYPQYEVYRFFGHPMERQNQGTASRKGLGAEGTARLKPAGPKADPELADARRRIKEPELGNGFLRRAAAYFAKGPA